MPTASYRSASAPWGARTEWTRCDDHVLGLHLAEPAKCRDDLRRRCAAAPTPRRRRRPSTRPRASRARCPRRRRPGRRSLPARSAVSTRRSELDELADPTTSTRSTSPAMARTRLLAVRGRVADVVAARPGRRREAVSDGVDDPAGLIAAERGLHEVGDLAGIGTGAAPATSAVLSTRPWRPAPRRPCRRPPRGRRARSAQPGSRRRRTCAPRRAPWRPAGMSRRRVQAAPGRLLPDLGRDAVRGEHHHGAVGHLVELVDEHRAAPLQLGHDVALCTICLRT